MDLRLSHTKCLHTFFRLFHGSIRVLICILLSFCITRNSSASEFYDEWSSSIAEITCLVQSNDDMPELFSGTGLLVRSSVGAPFVLTAGHVIDDAIMISVEGIVLDQFGASIQFSFLLNQSDICNNTIPHPDSRIDLSLIHIPIDSIEFNPTPTAGTVLTFMGIAQSDFEYYFRADIGDRVCVIGYPSFWSAEGFSDPVVREGSLSWIGVHQDLGSCFALDLPSFPGNSGSPVIHLEYFSPGSSVVSRPIIIGIVISILKPFETDTVDIETFPMVVTSRINVGLTFALPCNYVVELLELANNRWH